MKKEHFYLLWICIGFFAIGFTVAIGFISDCEKKSCDDSYLGVCFDEESIYYKCNMIEDKCSLQDWKSANVIKFMEETKLVIIGSSKCGWCQKQLEEFGTLSKSLIDKNLYIDCATKPEDICYKIEGTPSWSIDGEIKDSGFKSIDDLFNSISN